MELFYEIRKYVSKKDGQEKEAVNYFVKTSYGTKIYLKQAYDRDYGLLLELAMRGELKKGN